MVEVWNTYNSYEAMDKIMEETSYQPLKATHPKTNSSHLKMDGWNLEYDRFLLGQKAHFQVRPVRFKEGINKNLLTAPQEPVTKIANV